MAHEMQVATDFLVVLSEASNLASNFAALKKVLEQLSAFIEVLPFVCSVLALRKNFQEDTKHKEILKEFEKLGSKIGEVRDDVKELKFTVKWESVKLQYVRAASRITLGMRHCLDIGKAKDEIDKENSKQRLKELGSNQELALALNALMDGITGSDLFQSSILDEFYQKTKGHRPKISALASRLLQLVCGGLMVNATYEVAVRGKEGTRGMAKRFQKDLINVKAKVQSVLRKCQENFKEHMLSDLYYILDKNGSNKALLNELLALVRNKYDWQEHFCLVYDDLRRIGYHCFDTKYSVSCLHPNMKCGIIYFRTAGEPPTDSNRYNEALQIVNYANCYNAEAGYKNIVVQLAERCIGTMGCMVIYHSANVQLGGNFSTAYVHIVGYYARTIVLLQ